MYEDDFAEAPEDYSEPKAPDEYFLQAQKEIRGLYEEDREIVFYIRQIQVKFEKKFYHWITNNAMLGLNKIGLLNSSVPTLQMENQLTTGKLFHIQ